MAAIIEVSNLSKQFKDVQAVNNLSFTVQEGDIYGFLGQNGAGKSTTIRMLLTLITPSQGDIRIFGKKLHLHRNDILRQTGAVIEKPDLYKYLSAIDNLRIFSKLSGCKHTGKQLMEQLDRVGLAQRAHSNVKTFSQGMKQRLGIAIALVHNPQLVILDEPVNGLDPQGIADIRNLILHLGRDLKKTLFVSSHLLAEMEMVATRMLIIHKGARVVEGGVQELLNPARLHVELQTTDNAAALRLIEAGHFKAGLQQHDPNKITLELEKNDIPALVQQLVQAGLGVASVKPRHSLEDYFLQLTGH
jgi:ABC-type multidrug transport system ATPase subunit